MGEIDNSIYLAAGAGAGFAASVEGFAAFLCFFACFFATGAVVPVAGAAV